MAPRGMSTKAYQQLRRATLLAYPVCSRCGHPIDLTLSGRHPDGPTFDHTTPRSHGGHVLSPGTAMHNRCNAAKGNRTTTTPRTARTLRIPR